MYKSTEIKLGDLNNCGLNYGVNSAFEIAKRVTGIRDDNLWLTAGKVRDTVMGVNSIDNDFDFIGRFSLDEVAKRSNGALLGRWDNLGVVKMRIGMAEFDFINCGNSLPDRLKINDIDMSMLCMSQDGLIIDYFGGLESIRRRQVRMPEAYHKIQCDPTRIIRALRFASSLDFGIETMTLEAIIRNGHLLTETDYRDDLWKLLNLNNDAKELATDMLKKYELDRYISMPSVNENFIAYKVERELSRIVPRDDLLNLFPKGNFYLIGGAVRDVVWSKPIRDMDFKTDLTTLLLVDMLQKSGYQKTSNLDLLPNQYYINKRTGTVSIYLNGMDVDITPTGKFEIEEIINNGDINFSCGMYDLRRKKIVNPEKLINIADKLLEFCNIDTARNNPLIVVSALKQLSRSPDIKLSRESLEVIKQAIPLVIKFFNDNKDLNYKLVALGGNINSGWVRKLFSMCGGGEKLFDKYCNREANIKTGKMYVSKKVEEIPEGIKEQAIELIKHAFGDKCDMSKIFTPKITSIVYRIEDNRMVSCCLLSGERVYTPVAVDGQNWAEMISDLVLHNYNIWITVDAANLKIQTLARMSGLKAESDPEVLKKVLIYNNNEKYENICTSEENGILVYTRKSKVGYAQILFRS